MQKLTNFHLHCDYTLNKVYLLKRILQMKSFLGNSQSKMVFLSFRRLSMSDHRFTI